MTPQVEFFSPNPSLADEINVNICQSEVEGGVSLDELPVGARLDVETKNHRYEIVNRGRGQALIYGHPDYCPEPVLVRIHGSTWGGSMIRMHFIGRGMRLEFRHPIHGVLSTSRIREVRELPERFASAGLHQQAS